MDRTSASMHASIHRMSQGPEVAASESVPPLRGMPPYTQERYLTLPPSEKSEGLDFLILGKIPGGRQGDPDAAKAIEWEFEEVFTYCLKQGEFDALEFLWRESARDPEVATLNLTLDKPDATTIDTLVRHCGAHFGLKFNLYLLSADASAGEQLSGLIAQGSVPDLKLHGAGMRSDVLARLASAAARTAHALTLIDARFDEHGAAVFGDALACSLSLKKLTVFRSDFGASQGVPFIEGMQKNRSVAELKIRDVPLLTEPLQGCGALLEKNAVLERLEIACRGDRSADINALMASAANHPSLRQLELRNPEAETGLDEVSGLLQLFASNRVMQTLKVDAVLKNEPDYVRLAAAFKDNTCLTDFSLKRYAFKNAGIASSIDDTLARNRALAIGEIARKAGQVFDPDGKHADGMADAGSVVADHMLRNASSLAEFVNTMAVVELSIRELEKQGPITQSPAAPGATPESSDSHPMPPPLS